MMAQYNRWSGRRCGSGRKHGLLYWQSCSLKRIPDCSLKKKGIVVGWLVWEVSWGFCRNENIASNVKWCNYRGWRSGNTAISKWCSRQARRFSVFQPLWNFTLREMGSERCKWWIKTAPKSSGSACGWPSTPMGSAGSEVRSYVRLFWINMLLSVCLCVCACIQVGILWDVFMWFSSLEGAHCGFLLQRVVTRRRIQPTDLFTTIFLLSCATSSSILGPAHCSGTTAWPSPDRKMTWGSMSRVASAFALICLGFMPKHPSFNTSRWTGEKLNNCCSLLYEALLHFIKPFRDNSHSRRELRTCFTIIKLMKLPSQFRVLQLHVCWNTLLDSGPKMLVYVSAAVSSNSSYLVFFFRL